MLIVVMMGNWYDDSTCWVVHNVRVYSVLDTVVKMFVVVWCLGLWLLYLCLVLCGPIILMTSAISWPLW